MKHLRIAAVLGLAISLAGCSLVDLVTGRREAPPDDPCRPVDPGGECFEPSDAAFRDHAEASAEAWPQLDGLPIEAGPVLSVEDRVDGRATWIVPLVSAGSFVATSRFIRLEEDSRVKLAEIALLVPNRPEFPTPVDGERLVRYERPGCGNPLEALCVFSDSDLAILQVDGRYRRSDGTVVDALPG